MAYKDPIKQQPASSVSPVTPTIVEAGQPPTTTTPFIKPPVNPQDITDNNITMAITEPPKQPSSIYEYLKQNDKTSPVNFTPGSPEEATYMQAEHGWKRSTGNLGAIGGGGGFDPESVYRAAVTNNKAYNPNLTYAAVQHIKEQIARNPETAQRLAEQQRKEAEDKRMGLGPATIAARETLTPGGAEQFHQLRDQETLNKLFPMDVRQSMLSRGAYQDEAGVWRNDKKGVSAALASYGTPETQKKYSEWESQASNQPPTANKSQVQSNPAENWQSAYANNSALTPNQTASQYEDWSKAGKPMGDDFEVWKRQTAYESSGEEKALLKDFSRQTPDVQKKLLDYVEAKSKVGSLRKPTLEPNKIYPTVDGGVYVTDPAGKGEHWTAGTFEWGTDEKPYKKFKQPDDTFSAIFPPGVTAKGIEKQVGGVASFSFKTQADAEKASSSIPPGTIVEIGGKRYKWEK